MKGVTHFFISKDQMAVFWFLVCVGCIVGTGAYALKVVAEGRAKKTYVTVDPSPFVEGTILLDSSDDEDQQRELVLSQARLAVETLLNRGPNGPMAAARVGRLFTGNALDQVGAEVAKSLFDSRSRKLMQLCEVGPIEITKREDGTIFTRVTGQLVRTGVDPTRQEVFNQVLTFRADLYWEPNKNMRYNTLYPLSCFSVGYDVTLVQES